MIQNALNHAITGKYVHIHVRIHTCMQGTDKTTHSYVRGFPLVPSHQEHHLLLWYCWQLVPLHSWLSLWLGGPYTRGWDIKVITLQTTLPLHSRVIRSNKFHTYIPAMVEDLAMVLSELKSFPIYVCNRTLHQPYFLLL